MSDDKQTNCSEIPSEELINQLRDFVKRLMVNDISPADISYALSYVATELGLLVAPKPMEVFPVVLAGMSQAISDQDSEEQPTQATETEIADGPEPNVTIH